VEYSTHQSRFQKISSQLHQKFLISFHSTPEKRLCEIIDDLKNELILVRRDVFQEFSWMKDFEEVKRGGVEEEDETGKGKRNVNTKKGKRLIYLFVSDLVSGICGEVLANKAQRDAMISQPMNSTLSSSSSYRLSRTSQVIGWMFIFLMNFGMLFYVYLFAMTQTHARQSAWFQSFVMWLLFEIFLSSTGMVIFFHLLIPLYVLTEIENIKEKVLSDLIIFREKYLRRLGIKIETNGEDAEGKGTGGGDKARRGGGEAKGDLNGRECDNNPVKGVPSPATSPGVISEFNSAKYLFTSWRVASLCPELPESGLILEFKTLWPKRKYGDEGSEVAREYDQAVILTALSRVLVFFLSSLLHYHILIQDILIQLICNSGFGSLILLLIRSAKIHPLVPVSCGFGLFLCLYLLLKFPLTPGNLSKEIRHEVPINAILPSPPFAPSTTPSLPLSPLPSGSLHPPLSLPLPLPAPLSLSSSEPTPLFSLIPSHPSSHLPPSNHSQLPPVTDNQHLLSLQRLPMAPGDESDFAEILSASFQVNDPLNGDGEDEEEGGKENRATRDVEMGIASFWNLSMNYSE
jgi:hypothetical protein